METTGVFKVRELSQGEKVLAAPKEAQGYYRRDVSKDGNTITYRRVA